MQFQFVETSIVTGTPHIYIVHEYYLLAMEDGDRLSHLAFEPLNFLAFLWLPAVLRGWVLFRPLGSTVTFMPA
jgi:hypothetical protein